VTIALEPHAEGTILPIRAQPGASRNAVRGEQAGALKVSVTQVAEKGKANQAILEMLAEFLGMPKSRLELLSGSTGRQKRVLVRGIAPDELGERIKSALAKD
jgi:uncharacterized protein (TIGR00251 family)